MFIDCTPEKDSGEIFVKPLWSAEMLEIHVCDEISKIMWDKTEKLDKGEFAVWLLLQIIM